MAATRDVVLKKVKQMFPASKLEEVMEFLDLYGVETYEAERERVQLAILKLSDGRLDRLRSEVNLAKRDYRDVLAPAEYPLQLTGWGEHGEKSPAEKRAIEKDRKQYLDWLNSES